MQDVYVNKFLKNIDIRLISMSFWHIFSLLCLRLRSSLFDTHFVQLFISLFIFARKILPCLRTWISRWIIVCQKNISQVWVLSKTAQYKTSGVQNLKSRIFREKWKTSRTYFYLDKITYKIQFEIMAHNWVVCPTNESSTEQTENVSNNNR